MSGVGVIERKNAVNFLAECWTNGPSQQGWTSALNAILNRFWPEMLTMPPSEQHAAILEFSMIVEEARAQAADSQFTLEERLLVEALRVGALEEAGKPMSDLTLEQQEFYKGLQFHEDEGGKLRVFDREGRAFKTTLQ